MAILKTLTAATGLLAAVSWAAPVQQQEKRAVVWKTVTDVVVDTITITTTVTGTPGADQTITPEVTPTPAVVPSQTPTTLATSSSAPPQESQKAPEPVPQPAQFAEEPSTSSAPAPTWTPPPAPAPAPSQEPTSSAPVVVPPPAPTSSTPAEPSTPPTSGGGLGGGGLCLPGSPCSGEMTFYDGGEHSSCGPSVDSYNEDFIALPYDLFGNFADPNKNPLCGQTVTIKYNGVTSTAKIMDKCPGCQGQAIDLTRHLFNKFAKESDGRIYNAEWWLN